MGFISDDSSLDGYWCTWYDFDYGTLIPYTALWPPAGFSTENRFYFRYHFVRSDGSSRFVDEFGFGYRGTVSGKDRFFLISVG